MSSLDAAEGFRRLGLLDDPFPAEGAGSQEAYGVRACVRAATLRLLAAYDAAAEDEQTRPVIVETADLPAYYYINPGAAVSRAIALQQPVAGIVELYIPLDTMRIGRVRSALQSAAEWVAGVEPDITIGLISLEALAQPDESLPEWAALAEAGYDTSPSASSLAEDPAAFARRVFGEPDEIRQGAEDVEMLARVATARVDRLETDPAEGEAALREDEEATDDPMGDAFIRPLGEIDESALVESNGDSVLDDALAHYIIAYTRAHVSPVVARGIQAYRAQGTSSMTEELKVTKAPTKTLLALAKLARRRMRRMVLLYDGFDVWAQAPDDLRLKIVNTFVSLRWALKGEAALVFMLEPGTAPELEEAFAAAVRVPMRYEELPRVEGQDATFDRDAVLGWLDSASLAGERPSWADELISAVPENASLENGCRALQAAILDAAAKGQASPDAAHVRAVLAAGSGA